MNFKQSKVDLVKKEYFFTLVKFGCVLLITDKQLISSNLLIAKNFVKSFVLFFFSIL